MDTRTAVITGIGAIGPTGAGHARLWDHLVRGAPALGPIRRFDASAYPCRVAGEVADADLLELVEPRKLRTTTRASLLALAATSLALDDARLEPRSVAPEDLAAVVGTALGGWCDAEQQAAVLLERGTRRVNPFVVSGAGSHGPGIEVATALGARGPHWTFGSGCPAGLQAIGHAAALLERGLAEVCVAGGVEAPLSPLGFAGLCRTNELSTLNEPAARASRPFADSHAGMVLSEGACLLVLETAERAARRGATPYAAIAGSHGSCDAQGLHGLDGSGATGAGALTRLLAASGLAPRALDYVCCHANSAPAFDRKELAVLRGALGEDLAGIPISSIKGVIGHPFGAAGAFQTAAAALAMRHSLLPPTANLDTPAPGCAAEHVIGAARPHAVRHALVTSYGYGGINWYLLLRAAGAAP